VSAGSPGKPIQTTCADAEQWSVLYGYWNNALLRVARLVDDYQHEAVSAWG
jgi:hypothetical protein